MTSRCAILASCPDYLYRIYLAVYSKLITTDRLARLMFLESVAIPEDRHSGILVLGIAWLALLSSNVTFYLGPNRGHGFRKVGSGCAWLR